LDGAKPKNQPSCCFAHLVGSADQVEVVPPQELRDDVLAWGTLSRWVRWRQQTVRWRPQKKVGRQKDKGQTTPSPNVNDTPRSFSPQPTCPPLSRARKHSARDRENKRARTAGGERGTHGTSRHHPCATTEGRPRRRGSRTGRTLSWSRPWVRAKHTLVTMLSRVPRRMPLKGVGHSEDTTRTRERNTQTKRERKREREREREKDKRRDARCPCRDRTRVDRRAVRCPGRRSAA